MKTCLYMSRFTTLPILFLSTNLHSAKKIFFLQVYVNVLFRHHQLDYHNFNRVDTEKHVLWKHKNKSETNKNTTHLRCSWRYTLPTTQLKHLWFCSSVIFPPFCKYVKDHNTNLIISLLQIKHNYESRTSKPWNNRPLQLSSIRRILSNCGY